MYQIGVDIGGTNIKIGLVDDALEMVAFDAQTSGGMLLAVPRDRLEEVRAFLRENGDLDAVVGEVLPAQADDLLWYTDAP